MNDDNKIRHIYLHSYDRAVELIPTQQQAAALKVIRTSAEPVPATDVATALGVNIQHANMVLRGLRLKGYVKRIAHPRTTGGIEYHYEVAAC